MTKKNSNLPSWDLSPLYTSLNSKEIDSDLKKSSHLEKNFTKKYKSNITSLNASELHSAIKEYEKMEEILGRLSSFAYLYYAENMTDEKRSGFYQNIYEKINDISSELIFFTLEINQIENSDLKRMLTESQELTRYKPWLRDVREYRPHQLNDKLEQILHEKDQTGRQAWQRLFDETLADLQFNFRGESLNCAEIFDKMSSKDESIRKDAAKSISQTLKDNIKIFALITNTLAKDKSIDDKWRNFAKPISSRNLSNYIEDDVVDALISSVKDSYPALSHRYYKIKAKWLGKEKLEYWDRNAPLPDDLSDKISWEDAKEIVLSSYNAFSPKLGELGQKFFDNNWIDVAPKKGKDSGAFSHPTVPSANPYILLNYQGKVRDVMTLAHELGHGVHQLLSAKQGTLMADTPLTLAETASVFGEQLTFRKMLDLETDSKKKNIIIAGKVEDMLNTVVRQIAFCEFEREIHDRRKYGEIYAEEICDIWQNIQSESLGDGIKAHDDYKYYWSYIPHFVHSPFYVYSYAFGDCLVNSLYAKYLEGMDNFESKYFEMLKAGGTLRHKELLAPFGLDASKKDFWASGLKVISNFIDELEKS